MSVLNKTSIIAPELASVDGMSLGERGRRIGQYLQKGVIVSDDIFDRIYPLEVADLSKTNWTPVKVASIAAELLSEGGARRVLDVGSGCGKFCVVSSLITSSVYTGVDRSAYLTGVATQSAAALKTTGCEFIQADAFDLDWGKYNGFYLFNPFGDERDVLSDRARVRFSRLPVGVRVVTFFGFGAAMPEGYRLAKRLNLHGDSLDLWIKTQ